MNVAVEQLHILKKATLDARYRHLYSTALQQFGELSLALQDSMVNDRHSVADQFDFAQLVR